MRTVPAFLACATLMLLPLQAAAEEDYVPIISALPEDLPMATSPACLAGPNGSAEVPPDAGLLATYTVPFDEAAGQAMLDYLTTAINAASGSGVAAPGPADLDGLTPTEAMSRNFAELGLDPGNVFDVAAIYLVVIWAASEGDLSMISSLSPEMLAKVRNQVIAGEMFCASLHSVKDDLANQRNRMMALTGLLVDGMEAHSRSASLDRLAAVVRERLGRQVDGLDLTANGFAKP